jgi:hypothetical protein
MWTINLINNIMYINIKISMLKSKLKNYLKFAI